MEQNPNDFQSRQEYIKILQKKANDYTDSMEEKRNRTFEQMNGKIVDISVQLKKIEDSYNILNKNIQDTYKSKDKLYSDVGEYQKNCHVMEQQCKQDEHTLVQAVDENAKLMNKMIENIETMKRTTSNNHARLTNKLNNIKNFSQNSIYRYQDYYQQAKNKMNEIVIIKKEVEDILEKIKNHQGKIEGYKNKVDNVENNIKEKADQLNKKYTKAQQQTNVEEYRELFIQLEDIHQQIQQQICQMNNLNLRVQEKQLREQAELKTFRHKIQGLTNKLQIDPQDKSSGLYTMFKETCDHIDEYQLSIKNYQDQYQRRQQKINEIDQMQQDIKISYQEQLSNWQKQQSPLQEIEQSQNNVDQNLKTVNKQLQKLQKQYSRAQKYESTQVLKISDYESINNNLDVYTKYLQNISNNKNQRFSFADWISQHATSARSV